MPTCQLSLWSKVLYLHCVFLVIRAHVSAADVGEKDGLGGGARGRGERLVDRLAAGTDRRVQPRRGGLLGRTDHGARHSFVVGDMEEQAACSDGAATAAPPACAHPPMLATPRPALPLTARVPTAANSTARQDTRRRGFMLLPVLWSARLEARSGCKCVNKASRREVSQSSLRADTKIMGFALPPGAGAGGRELNHLICCFQPHFTATAFFYHFVMIKLSCSETGLLERTKMEAGSSLRRTKFPLTVGVYACLMNSNRHEKREGQAA